MGFTKVSEMLSILIWSKANHDGIKTGGFLLTITAGAFSSYIPNTTYVFGSTSIL